MRFPDLLHEVHRLQYLCQELQFQINVLNRVVSQLPGAEALDPGVGPWDDYHPAYEVLPCPKGRVETDGTG